MKSVDGLPQRNHKENNYKEKKCDIYASNFPLCR